MLDVFQFTTIFTRVKRAMQLSSVMPSCVSAPPFCVVRLVRLLVNWYSQSTPELALGRAWANNTIEDMAGALSGLHSGVKGYRSSRSCLHGPRLNCAASCQPRPVSEEPRFPA